MNDSYGEMAEAAQKVSDAIDAAVLRLVKADPPPKVSNYTERRYQDQWCGTTVHGICATVEIDGCRAVRSVLFDSPPTEDQLRFFRAGAVESIARYVAKKYNTKDQIDPFAMRGRN